MVAAASRRAGFQACPRPPGSPKGLRYVQNLRRPSDTLQPPILQLEADWKPCGERRAVRDDDQDTALPMMQIEKQRRDLIGRGAIEIAGRLVAQEHPGRAHQRARDGDAL